MISNTTKFQTILGFLTTCLLAFMLLNSPNGFSAIYQCKNAVGKIAFQDHPCADADINENQYRDKTGTITVDERKHFLWKATRQNDTIFLLGSIHVGRPDMYPLNRVVTDAFGKSDALMVEVNTELVNQLELAQKMSNIGLYPNGTTLESQLPSELWEKLVATAKALNVPELLLRQQKPWLASITLATAMMTQSGYQSDFGIDRYFIKQAGELNKPIIELESVASQMQLFANFSAQEQIDLLSNGLDEMQKGSIMLDKLVTAWVEGDHQALDKLSRESMGIDSKKSSLYQSLIVDRNQAMVKKVLKAVQDHKKYFVVVGAAHLVGPQGIPELLKSQGFSIVEL